MPWFRSRTKRSPVTPPDNPPVRRSLQGSYREVPGEMVLHLWQDAVWHSMGKAYTVFYAKSPAAIRRQPDVLLLVWQFGHDTPIRQATLDAQAFETHLQAGRSIAVTLVGVALMPGMDGMAHGIVFEQMGFGYSLTWWSSPPEEWRPLAAWAQGVMGYLAEVIEREGMTVQA
ncbi:MAG: hypothetical protein SF029_23965 [bacterium]|nr:hypothetical protein [bacterium]